MEGGTLFISSTIATFSWFKSVFDDCGFKGIIPRAPEKNELYSLLNELKPKNVFIDSEFYSCVTPYMISGLLKKIPELNIIVVNFGCFPDSLAARFIVHGAKSYINFKDGADEFRNGLMTIKSGQVYYSKGVERHINDFDEMPNYKKEITEREWQVLFLVCNGHKNKGITANLLISRRTVDTHIRNLKKILDGKDRNDLTRKAVFLEWVKKEHLGFNGDEIEIPQHPSKKRNKKITPAHGGGG